MVEVEKSTVFSATVRVATATIPTRKSAPTVEAVANKPVPYVVVVEKNDLGAASSDNDQKIIVSEKNPATRPVARNHV